MLAIIQNKFRNIVACRPVARQQQRNKQLYTATTEYSTETVFSTLSVSISNKKGQLAVEVSESVRKQLWFSHCELLLLEAGT
jgi:hypothetical protein